MGVHVVGRGFMPPASATNFGGGVGLELTPGAPTDLSRFTGISFWAESGPFGDIISDILVEISTTDTDPTYCKCLSAGNCSSSYFFLLKEVPMSESKFTVKWTDLKQSGIGTPVRFDPTQVLKIMFASNGPVPYFNYWIDEVSVTK